VSCSEGSFEEETEQALLEELIDSDQCSSSSDDESSGIDDLAVDEVIAMECSDEEGDIVQGASAPSAPSATFKWEDITNYVWQREQFVGNCGPKNEA
jgi:hypothetical protein